jgi:hypothetical protein
MTTMFALMYSAEIWAWGGHNPHFFTTDEVEHSSKVGSISLPFWAWSTGLVKISIACMLLRFSQGKRWRLLLYFMVALNIVLIGYSGIFGLFRCIPYRTIWDFRGEVKVKKCFTQEVSVASQYVAAACNVSTDVVFSLVPRTFLGKIRRPLREKVVIGGLMALGLIASGFSLARAVITAHPHLVHNIDALINTIGLLSCLEVQTSLIAACIPTLRSTSKKILQRLGLINSTAMTHTDYPPYGDGSPPVTIGLPTKCHHTTVRREIDHIDAESAEGHDLTRPTTSGSLRHQGGENGVEELYEADPVTGRIMCVKKPGNVYNGEPSKRADSATGREGGIASWKNIGMAW